MNSIWDSFTGFAPRLLGAVLVLIVVLVAAWVLRRLVVKFLQSVDFDDLFERTDAISSLRRIGIGLAPSVLVGYVVLWGIILAGVAAALSILGLSSLQANIDLLVSLVGRGLIAILILGAGLVAAGWLSNLAVQEAERSGLSGGEILRRVVFAVVLIVAGLLACAQLGIDVSILILISVILLGTLGLVGALALGLGLAPISTNIAAARYAQANIEKGDLISVNDMTGVVEDLNYASVTLKSENGDLHFIPNRALLEATVTRKAPPEQRDGEPRA